MSQAPTGSLPPTDDTPVDERPPYGDDGGRWRLALVVGLVALALVVVAYAASRAVRAVWRTLAHERTRGGVIYMYGADEPYAGPMYRVEFFDDQYRQLADLDLRVALPALRGPAADAALDALARECRREVESRDAQRCFRPRLVVLDVDGSTLRTWHGVA